MRAIASQPDRASDIAERVKVLSAHHGPRGPVALVVAAESISSAQRYAFSQNRQGAEMQVFWDRDEAAAWLDERLSATPVAPQTLAS